jgi:D-alanine transaminase
MGEIAYVNGKWTTPEKAMIPAEDRGYLFGDALYEVVSGFDGRLWALERHLRRLERGIREVDMQGVDIAHIRSVIQEAFRRSKLSDALIYIQLTRGVAPRRHDWPLGLKPGLFAFVRPLPQLEARFREEGAPLITTPEIRWGRCDIKSTNLLPNCLARHKAHAAGALDAVFVRPDGIVTECASNSLFIVKKGRLITRENGPHILPGITRELVLETAERLGIPADLRPFTREELFAADEAFLTGTSLDLLPVTRVDGRPIGGGTAGEVTKRLRQAYLERRERGDDAPRP